MSPRPILILSAGRSGSNLLKSFFKPDAAILDVGEILNPTFKTHNPKYGFWSPDNPEWARRLAESRPDWKAPYAIFREYARAIVADKPERRYLIDLKYHNMGPVDALWRMPDDTPPPLAGFLALDAAVLHLIRRNPLAQFCSLRLAVETGRWVERMGESATEPAAAEISTLVVDTRHLADTLRRIEFRSGVADLWIARHARKITLDYENLLEGDRLADPIREEICAVIGADIDLSGLAGTQKVAPPLAQSIANLEEVRAALRDTEFAWCVDEAPAPKRERGRLVSANPAVANAFAAARIGNPGRLRRAVLLVRELPGSLGGAIDLVAIADRLAAEGFRPVLATPDGPAAGGGRFPFLPAPLWPALCRREVKPDQREYAELLAAIGFADPAAVAGMRSAWMALIEAVRPAAIVADQSPGLVATGAAGSVPLITIGGPATLPPITPHGFPQLMSLRRPPPPFAQMLDSLRAVGRNAETNDAAGFASLLDTPHRLVFGLPELDPYHWSRNEMLVAPREACGPLSPRSEIRRLLAVLPPALRDGTLRSAILAADPGARIVEEPLEIEALRGAVAEASHVLCLARSAISTAALCTGRPQLLILDGPGADIAVRLVEQQQVGRRIDPKLSQRQLFERISTFLVDMYLAENALVLANRIACRQQPDGIDMLAGLVAGISAPAYAGDRARRERAPAAQPS